MNCWGCITVGAAVIIEEVLLSILPDNCGCGAYGLLSILPDNCGCCCAYGLFGLEAAAAVLEANPVLEYILLLLSVLVVASLEDGVYQSLLEETAAGAGVAQSFILFDTAAGAGAAQVVLVV